MVRAALLLVLLNATGSVIAQTQQESADDAVTWGNDNSTPVIDAGQSAVDSDDVPGFAGTDTPLGDYYDNQNTGGLESDAINAAIVAPDPTAEYAWGQSNTPILEFSEDDPLLVHSWGIQSDTSVEEGELILAPTECTDGTVTVPETTIETCTAWTVPEDAYCDNSLDVAVDVNDRVYTAIFRADNDAGTPFGGGGLAVSPDLNDRNWSHDHGIGSNGEVIGTAQVLQAFGMPTGFDCSSITNIGVNVAGNFTLVDQPTCFSPPGGRPRMRGDVFYRSGTRGGGIITYTVTAGATPVYTDTWTDNCPGMISGGPCETQGPPLCEEGPEERLITGSDGLQYPVFRDCWRYRTPLICSGSVTTDEGYCGELIDRGCSPVDSQCDGDGTCEHTYECPLDGWSEPVDDCTATTFGVSGVEFDTSVDPSNDFGQAAANIQAMEEAALDMDSGGVSCTETPAGSGNYDCVGDLTIFNGEDLRCKKAVLGFSNCCSRSGWGLGWADDCDAEEEQLRAQRNEGQCHYVGQYCSEDSIFGCLAKTSTYCCFRSKLGRIIHEQGRPQISMAWGGAQDPECEGFTAEQLASVDFSVIDFSEYFADAFANVAGGPDNATMESIIDAYISTLSGSGCSQFDPNYPTC